MNSPFKRVASLLLLTALLSISSAQAQGVDRSGLLGSALNMLTNDPMLRSYVSNKVRERAVQDGFQSAANSPYYNNAAAAPAMPGMLNSVAGGLVSRILPTASGLLPAASSLSAQTGSIQNALLPALGQIAASRLAGRSQQAQGWNNRQLPYSPPDAGFYSIEEGMRLGGGTGYSRSALNYNQGQNYQGQGNMSFSTKLAPSELARLSKYDISILIDRSGSMNQVDCPDLMNSGGLISRWQWCKQQSSFFAEQTAGALPSGISIVPFAGESRRYTNVSPSAVSAIFNGIRPEGSTNLAAALRSELDRYFQERDLGLRKRPLMLAIISDGAADNEAAISRVIADAVSKLHSPDELKIDFFLIGDESKANRLLNKLAMQISQAGMPANMLVKHSFSELNRNGLGRSLAGSINSNSKKPAYY